jgi:hypothetical protein
MPPKKKLKCNISGLRNQSSRIDPSHADHNHQIQGSLVVGESSPPDPQIDNDVNDKEWTPNVQFDSSKLIWDDEASEDDIESKDEEDFPDKIEEEKPGLNHRKYRNKGLHVALM